MNRPTKPRPDSKDKKKVQTSFHLLGGDIKTYLTKCIIGSPQSQVHLPVVEVSVTFSTAEAQQRDAKVEHICQLNKSDCGMQSISNRLFKSKNFKCKDVRAKNEEICTFLSAVSLMISIIILE